MITVLLGWFLTLAMPAQAGGEAGSLTMHERACQVGRARAVYDMILAQGACFRRCHARGNSACATPEGDAVSSCLAKAQTRALRLIFGRSCGRDCPECYGGCGSDVATGEVEYSSALVAGFTPLVFCSPEAPPDETRCQGAVARAAAWFARAYGRCFARCQRARCDGAGDGDARTAACAARAVRRAARVIDARCESAGGGSKPACYGRRTGPEWITLVRGAVDTGRPVIFCASPAGAFLETT